jgi:hypothetical protein
MPDWWFRRRKGDEDESEDEQQPAATAEEWRCSYEFCRWGPIPYEQLRCPHCGVLRPDYVPPDDVIVDAQTHVPNIEVSFSNVPRSWRREPGYEQVAERYGWVPPWRSR